MSNCGAQLMAALINTFVTELEFGHSPWLKALDHGHPDTD